MEFDTNANITELSLDGPRAVSGCPIENFSYINNGYGMWFSCVLRVGPVTAGVDNKITIYINGGNTATASTICTSQLSIFPINGSLSTSFVRPNGSVVSVGAGQTTQISVN